MIFSHYANNYWDFEKSKTSGIHKIAKYPAVMVAPMQAEILTTLRKENPDYITLLDPFHGSGVSLVEGGLIGLHVYGVDINPYAYLIAKVKLTPLDKEKIFYYNSEIKRKISINLKFDLYNFKNITKWFREDIINDLSKIRHLINDIPDRDIRFYYWLCFGEVVRIHSNTRTSTFKLHVKNIQNIFNMENNVFGDFIERINMYYNLIPENIKYNLFCGDAIEKIKTLASSSFDIICTSPPYGDNHTTVTYGQFSSLQLNWIDIEDIGCSKSWISNFSKIDSASLGGNAARNILKGEYQALNNFMNTIQPKKRKKVARFTADYEIALIEMARVLRPGGTLVLTLANRRIDNKEMPLVRITQEIVSACGLTQDDIICRNIKNKRMPYKLSNVNKYGAVSSMSKEIVLILTKPLKNQ